MSPGLSCWELSFVIYSDRFEQAACIIRSERIMGAFDKKGNTDFLLQRALSPLEQLQAIICFGPLAWK